MIDRIVVTGYDYLLNGIPENLTGEIWFKQGDTEVPMSYAIKGKIVNAKQWHQHLFSNKLEDLIDGEKDE